MNHPDQDGTTVSTEVSSESSLENALLLEKEKLEKRITDLQVIIDKAKDDQQPLLRRLANVCELLPAESRSSVTTSGQTSKHRRHTEHVKELAKQILSQRPDEDMHYKDLADKILELGGELRGQDPGLTLVALISPDPDFTRPNRKGHYALTKNFPDSRNVGERINQRSDTHTLPDHRAPYVGRR